jgi:hypothetical protein
MQSLARHLCSLIAAAAVLLVSVTCTSAGCVLQTEAQASALPVAKAACCSHSERASDQHNRPGKDDNHCPLCHGPTFVAKNVKSASQDDFHIAVFAICPTYACVTVAPISSPVYSKIDTAFSSEGPPTLLALHCALQT